MVRTHALSSWRILNARSLVTRPAAWHGFSRSPAYRSPTRTWPGGRLSDSDGHLQPRPRLVDGYFLAAPAGRGLATAAARATPQPVHCTAVCLVQARAAAHVGHRTRRHRSRYGVVGWRTVQRPPGLGHPARLPQGATHRGRAGVCPQRPGRISRVMVSSP